MLPDLAPSYIENWNLGFEPLSSLNRTIRDKPPYVGAECECGSVPCSSVKWEWSR